MARAINRLTARTVAALKEPGLHADGAGLYLRIDQTLNRRWVWVYFWHGRRREMGLGSAQTVELKEARRLADDARKVLASGLDPIAARKAEQVGEMTFGVLAERVIADLAPGWRNPKAEKQWRASLKTHAASIWKLPVSTVDTRQVVDVLQPIWTRLPETASRVRARIERILDVARVEGLRKGENPARWRGHLQIILPRQTHQPGHHAALSYEDVPAFLERLRQREAIAARALEFTILTAMRTSEVLGTPKAEIQGALWIIPGERMKAAREHRVPLCARAIEIVEEMSDLNDGSEYLFPGDQRIEPLSNMAMLMLLRRMEETITVHGFRSAFRDWAGDCTDYPRELIEQALAHTVGSAVERAYRRRDALEKRRKLMDDWGAFCTTPPNSNVIPFRAS